MNHEISFDRHSYSKLSGGSNYHSWRNDAQCALTMKGVWCAIETEYDAATAPPPERMRTRMLAAEPQQQTWDDRVPTKEQDQLARAILASMVTAHLQSLVLKAPTAKQAWDSLHRLYRESSKALLLELQNEVCSLAMQANESVTEYHMRTIALQDQLVEAGDTAMSEELLLRRFLSGFPKQWSHFIDLLVESDRHKCIETIIPRLVHKEAQFKAALQEELALYANNSKQQDHGRRRSTNGGAPDRQADGGFHNAAAGQPRRETRTCFYCRRVGHVIRDCRDKKRDEGGAGAHAGPW